MSHAKNLLWYSSFWWGVLLLLQLFSSLDTHTKCSVPKATGLSDNPQPRPSMLCFNILAGFSWKQRCINGAQGCLPFLLKIYTSHCTGEKGRGSYSTSALKSLAQLQCICVWEQHRSVQDTWSDREHQVIPRWQISPQDWQLTKAWLLQGLSVVHNRPNHPSLVQGNSVSLPSIEVHSVLKHWPNTCPIVTRSGFVFFTQRSVALQSVLFNRKSIMFKFLSQGEGPVFACLWQKEHSGTAEEGLGERRNINIYTEMAVQPYCIQCKSTWNGC